MLPQIFTIGVYGFDEIAFFNALTNNNIDIFCDVRMRRGVRGAKYSFVNSTYLQKKLASLNIDYIHIKELAPSKQTREKQKSDDKNKNVKKRDRTVLSQVFIEAYEHENLTNFNSLEFIQSLGVNAHNILLFCVEQSPEACHRSLVAKRISTDLILPITHLLP